MPEPTDLVIQEANSEDILHTSHAIGHRQVTHGVSQQEDVGFALQLLEVFRVLTHGAVLVVCVDELTLESPEETLKNRRQCRMREEENRASARPASASLGWESPKPYMMPTFIVV